VQFNRNGGAWSNTVNTTSLGNDIYIAVGLTHTPYSRVKLNDVLTYALPSGAVEWDQIVEESSPFSFPVLAYGDATSIIHSGDAVTAWNDLSGNGHHIEVSYGTPTYSDTAYDGIPGIVLTGADGMRTATPFDFAGNAACFGFNMIAVDGPLLDGRYWSWIVDTGATDYLSGNITSYRPNTGIVSIYRDGDGVVAIVTGLIEDAPTEVVISFSGTQCVLAATGASNTGAFSADIFTTDGRLYLGKTQTQTSAIKAMTKWVITPEGITSDQRAELLAWLAS
jgi:hypothetical protein